MTTCASISNQAKCDQSVSQNEISCKFVSGVCQEFHQNNSQNCHLNLTALTNYECKQINDICELNYRSGIGCTASSCNLITNSGICVLQYPKGTSCSWDATLNKCQANTCSSYTSQTICTQSYQDYNIKCFWCDSKCVDSNYCEEVIKDYHKECNNKNQKHTVSKYQTCGLTRPNCSDYLSYSSCKFTTNGTKCLFVWTTVAGSSLPTTGLCQGLCTSFTNQTSCQANSNNCIWLGSCIAANRNCSDYSSTDCDTAITRIGTKCTIDISASCVERTCSNYKNGSNRIPTNQTDCDNWLDNCIFVTNICIDACQLAPISSSIIYTISICEQYKPNKICTTGDEPKCGNFLEFCSQATQEQCHYNSNNEKCFWNSNLSKCFDLKECSVLNSFNDTHEECIQLLNFCTVNDQQNGCKNLTDCQNYQYSFQCKINQNQDLCMWDVDKCITIECYHYTVESSCENSSFKSDPNKKCIWDHVNLKCILLNCDDLQIDQTHSCSDYTQYCINQNCKAVDCEDFQYDNETQCQQLYADKHCRTDGQSCLQRLNCNDCQKQICCNFDKNLNDCIWIYGKCYDRNCNSMPIIPLTYQECQLVSNSCTLKSDGGCQQKTNCNTYKNEYECLFDLNENNCLWDEFLQQCFSDICQPICGDGIVTYPFEECDDNNNRPYDGCYECKIQCSLGCLMCEGQICLKCNQNGWIYNSITQQCDSICGDGIITILEKCDDGNSIQFDGCYECDYQCSLECLNCYQGECLECQYGYYISNSYCYNKCGDGIIILEKEECDDGNLFDNDGCNSKCQIQQNWKCFIQDQQSFCIQQDQPLPILQMINQNPTQILFSFSQQVELSQSKYSSKDFINSISISISNLDKNKFNFTLTPLTEISRELLDVQYKIDLKFLNSIKNPILQLLFDKSILVNEIGNSPSSNNITLKLTDIEQLTNFQKTITDTAAYFNSIVIYVIISIAIVSTFLGNFEIFWNLLDNLQQLSYIKYININYPINFSVFLAIFDLISFQPVQNYINLDSILERFIQQDPPLIEYNVGKFQIFQTNCFFGTNFQSFVIILLISLVCYWTSQIFVYLLFKSKYSDLVVIVDTQARFIIAKFIAFLHSIQQMAMMYIRSYFYQGLVRIFLSSYYDLTFSSLLQIATYSQSTLILFISSILSIGTFGFNLLSILGFYSYSLLSNKLIKTVNSNMFFDGINLTFNKWNSQYQTILLLKKTTFISALVLLQVIPICQTLFISFQSISFTLYIIISKPMIKAYENFKIIVFEISIYLNSILFICHDLEYFNQYRMLIGWINIALFSGNLVCCLLIDIYQQFKILKENLCKSAPQTKDQINPMGFQKC